MKNNNKDTHAKALYICLLKKCLLNLIYKDKPSLKIVETGAEYKVKTFDEEARLNGKDIPSLAHTMIGIKRMDNIQYCIENIIKEKVPGDLIETGVWRGGATIFMRGILKAWGIADRKVWVADSFEGLPMPDREKFPLDNEWNISHFNYLLSVSLEEVKRNFELYNLLDEQVEFIKGWFKDSLPKAHIDKLAVLRLDGDFYESTIDSLNCLYSKLSIGGYVIIDDYDFLPCKQAVTDFRNQNHIDEEINAIDNNGVFWKRLN